MRHNLGKKRHKFFTGVSFGRFPRTSPVSVQCAQAAIRQMNRISKPFAIDLITGNDKAKGEGRSKSLGIALSRPRPDDCENSTTGVAIVCGGMLVNRWCSDKV